MSGGHATAGVGDEVQRMQDGVRDWVEQTAARGKRALRSASPAVILSLLCASAFSPLLMATGIAGAGIAVLSSVGSGFLAQVISDVIDRLRDHGEGRTPSRKDLEAGITQRIQQILAAGDEHADELRHDIASVLKEIDAGGTALRAAMEQENERVRSDVIAAIGVLGSDFSELGFLIKDVAQAAAEIRQTLDVQGADVRTIIEQNDRQSTDIRLILEDLAVIAARTARGTADVGRLDDSPRWVNRCPYRGLLPFGETDADVFYGRERLAAELAVKLNGRVVRGGLIVVTGASGAGKSSLLRAGLLPILSRGQQVPGSDRWARIVMTPTKDPLTELAARLAAIGGNDTVTVRDGLIGRPDQAHLAFWSAVLAAASRNGQAGLTSGADRLVLIVDQFEQIFTLNPGLDGEARRQAFIAALHAAATSPIGPGQQPPALVTIAVRGDFWDRCAAYPELAEALRDGQFIVGPMSESEFRVAITGPADAAGLHIDPALTDTILSDLRAVGGDGAAGVLPLLSQAMALTWERREGDRLTSHGYSQAGGISHAVQTGADKVYDALPAAQQALAHDVLRSMTVASREGRLSRRPLTRAELYSGLPAADQKQLDAVLEAFAAERLIVLNEDTAQISHDVLLRAWPKLRAWLEEDQASWILYSQLADAADAWHDSNDDPSFLYRGSHLTALQQAVTQWSANPGRYPALTSTQRSFLQASERATTRSSRQRRAAVAVLAVLAVFASVASVFAFQQSSTALQQRDQAIYSQTAAEALQLDASNPSLAAELNLSMYRKQATPSLTSRLVSTENQPLSATLRGDPGPIYSVSFSPDGRTLASTGYGGTPRLWNVGDSADPHAFRQPSAKGGGLVYSVAFSPHGLLASISKDGTVQLWAVADPAHPKALGRPMTGTGLVYAAAFSSDGHTLATGGKAAGSGDPVIRLWDVTDPAHPRSLGSALPASPRGEITQVLFSPNGRTLAATGIPANASTGEVRLWDVTDPARPLPVGPKLAGGGIAFHSAAFSPDGRILAIPYNDLGVRLFDVADPRRPHLASQDLYPGIGSIYSVAFSRDGRTLAAASETGSIQLWNMADPASPVQLGEPLSAPSGIIYSIAFSPDGHTLASGNNDGTIRLWSIPRTVLTGPIGELESVVFSPDGRIMAAGGDDGTVRLWNVADPAHPRQLGKLGGGPLNKVAAIVSVTFSPDGRILAAGDNGGTVRLWNVAEPAHPRLLGHPLKGNQGGTYSIAFRPDGRILAAGGFDGKLWFWNVADPAHPRLLGHPLIGAAAAVFSVAFSPDGRMLASGGGNSGMVRLWIRDSSYSSTFRQLRICATGIVHSVAFSPDSRTLAGGCEGGAVKLWDLTDPAKPRPLGQPLTGSAGTVYSVTFSRVGNLLASAGYDATVRLWNVVDPAHPRALGQPLTTGIFSLKSVAFRRDGTILASAGADGTVRLWNLKVGYAIQRICATTRNVLTPRLWPSYIHRLPYQPPCVY